MVRAIEIQEALTVGDPDNAAYQQGLATSYHGLGSVYDGQGDYENAVTQYRAAIEMR